MLSVIVAVMMVDERQPRIIVMHGAFSDFPSLSPAPSSSVSRSRTVSLSHSLSLSLSFSLSLSLGPSKSDGKSRQWLQLVCVRGAIAKLHL